MIAIMKLGKDTKKLGYQYEGKKIVTKYNMHWLFRIEEVNCDYFA